MLLAKTALLSLLPLVLTTPITSENVGACRQTKIAIIGAGTAGIAAAQALHNASISDFLIIDVNDYVGGRIAHTTFGKDPSTGKPYTVELGANWVQGLGTEGGPENLIWTLAKKWNITNTYSDYESILTYDQTGQVDFGDLFDGFEEAYSGLEQDAGTILTKNLQDRSLRAGLSIRDWKPKQDMQAQAVEWWDYDFEYSYPPEQSSQTWSVVNYNLTFYQFSDRNNFVTDQRGFNHFLISEANTFLKPNDPRLVLSTNITKIDYTSPTSVTLSTSNGACIQASYAISTVSLGVLQNDIIEFSPKFPTWKIEAIEGMQMGTYTKIFFQFSPSHNGSYFWEVPSPKVPFNNTHAAFKKRANIQFFLYADPEERGYYPIFQSLTPEEFLPGSGIVFVTVVGPQSYIIEKQSDETTKNEVLGVLRDMFGKENVPDPLDFMYPRWSTEKWSMGSYSNWPVGLSIETHQNLRANLNRLWFAGEALSVEYFGFLQGAYEEGVSAAKSIASCLKRSNRTCERSAERKRYEVVVGCTNE